MAQVDSSLLVLLVLAGLGLVSGNHTITIAILVLLIVKLTPLSVAFPWIEKYGLTAGISILTIAVMTPIALGKINTQSLLHAFVEWKSILAILIGVIVSWLGARGVVLMSVSPSLVAGLLIGTIIGVALFKGVPVGPLIAAGILSLLVGKS